MTAPVPQPIPLDPNTALTWCSSCGVHYATTTKPLCVVCLDDIARAAR